MKSKAYLVDSNIWVGLYCKDDSLHDKAIQLMTELDQTQTQVIVSNFIIQETFTVLSKRLSQAEALAFYDVINHQEKVIQLDITKKIMQQITALMQHQNLQKILGFIDYSNIFLANEFNFELVTFDENLLKVYQSLQN